MESTLRLDGQSERGYMEIPERHDKHSSGVSWSAVVGGAFVAAAISLILLALGTGFGLSVVSPWSNVGASAAALGGAAIVWLIVTQVIPYALGGYLAGRLRTKWVAVHTDEVYFRDTANGFLVWAVGVVMTVAFLVSAVASMVGGSAREPGAEGRATHDPQAYFIDRLFRSDATVLQPADVAAQAEAGRILVSILRHKGSGGADDEAYLAKLVAAKTGLSQAEAARRVSQVSLEARQAEDAARQTASRLLLWFFLALLMGAFSASYAATIGGRQRDHVKAI
jgi:hypothetical protein